MLGGGGPTAGACERVSIVIATTTQAPSKPAQPTQSSQPRTSSTQVSNFAGIHNNPFSRRSKYQAYAAATGGGHPFVNKFFCERHDASSLVQPLHRRVRHFNHNSGISGNATFAPPPSVSSPKPSHHDSHGTQQAAGIEDSRAQKQKGQKKKESKK